MPSSGSDGVLEVIVVRDYCVAAGTQRRVEFRKQIHVSSLYFSKFTNQNVHGTWFAILYL
jgi:hypothetical protein